LKKYLFVCFFIVITFLIVCGVFYTINPRLDTEEARKEEKLRSLDKQISIYRSDDPYTYYILENLYEEKGNIYRRNGEYSEAYNCYREAIQFAKKDKNHRHVAKLAWFMIELAAEQKQSALVLTLGKKYQKIIVQHDYYPFNFYYWWGMAYLAENNLEAAQKTLNKGLKYLNSKRDYNYSEQKVMIYCALSTIYARKQDFSKCEEYLSKTNKLFTEDCTLSRTEDSYNIYISNAAYLSLKSSLIEIEKSNPPRSVALGEAYCKLAECYSYKDPKNYKINMLKAIKMYPPASPQISEVYFKLGEFFHKEQKYYFDKCVLALAGAKSNSAAKMFLEITFKEPYEYQDKSFHLLKLALKALPDSNKDPYVTTRILCRLADYYSEKKDWQKAAAYAQKSFEYAKKVGKTEISLEFVLESYGYVDNFYKMQKNMKKRIKNAENAVALMKNQKEDFFYLNEAYNRLGKIYKLDKRYSDAEISYRKITKSFAENPKSQKEIEYLIQEINAYCEIGDLCLLQKAPKRAEEAFDKASNLLKRKTIAELTEWYFADVCFNIANGYYYLNKDKLAEKYYKKSLALLLSKKKTHRKLLLMCIIELGKLPWGKKENKKLKILLKKV
jgi:tetratricopeptide (TPR) repeat protein